MVEQAFYKGLVTGSIPVGCTFFEISMKPLFANQHEAALIANPPIGGTGMLCREVKDQSKAEHAQKCHKAYDDALRNTGPGEGLPGYLLAPYQELLKSSPFSIGTVLAVKEAHAVWRDGKRRGVWYRADNGDIFQVGKWTSGAAMPRELVRSYIRITGLRAARIQEITNEEAELLGYSPLLWEGTSTAWLDYRYHLERDDKKRWVENKFYWLPTFEKVDRPS